MTTQSNVQLYFNATQSGDFCFNTAQQLNRGDVIQITRSENFVTRTGHDTVRVLEFTILQRCSIVLPSVKSDGEETFHQIDVGTQRRNRVLYWILNYNDLQNIVQRSNIVQQVRQILVQNNAIEIDTPILQPLYGGAFAQPFTTHYNAQDRDVFLRISPELYLKRMIVAGLPFVFEIARCFRNEGVDRIHNPEFTLLEFYQVNRDWQWGMEFCQTIVSSVLNTTTPFHVIDYNEALRQHGHDPSTMSAAQMDHAFSQIESTFIEPTFVTGHSVEMSPLAYSSNGVTAERFELYINGMEIANGYTEQNDAVVQRERMPNIDEDYLTALSYGMPMTCGVGIGIDRLVMLAVQRSHIADVIPFPA